ncbi:MAG: hypothetical protein K2Q33_00720 [Gammaproteobacteria bacterium]|nr:hypothetical protein [Gammaproteobacteria bacterium]
MASVETEFPFLIQASSSDNQERYAPARDWDNFLKQNMLHVSNLCTQAKPYEDIYREIARNRQEFALQKNVEYADRHGTIRADLSSYQLAWSFGRWDLNHLYEHVSTEKSCWSKQAPAIIEAVSAEISPFSFFHQPQYGEYTISHPWKKSGEESPTSTISLSQDRTNSYYVEIVYSAPIKGWQTSSKMFIAMMTAKSIPEFLKCTADFLYYESHVLRCLRGSESLLQIIVGGIAHFKGIELKFNSNLKIGWNFKALITKDEEKYRNWFIEHVFSTPKQIREQRDMEMLAESPAPPPVERPKDEYLLRLQRQIAADFQHEGLLAFGFFGSNFCDLPASIQELIDAETFKDFCLMAKKHSEQRSFCSEKATLLCKHIVDCAEEGQYFAGGGVLGTAYNLHNELFMAGFLTKNNKDVIIPELPLEEEHRQCLIM